jgi:hydrogenase nickel incorporation protein HypB
VVVLSVTEGEDKPLKYSHMFRSADLMILNKIDLLPYVPFNVDRCVGYARQVNPALKVLRLSVLKGEGMNAWYSFLRERKAVQSVTD